MKVIADRAASWRTEIECSECESDLEVSADDLLARAPDAGDDDMFLCEAAGGEQTVVVSCICGACSAPLDIEASMLPPFAIERAVAKMTAAPAGN